MKIEKFKAIIMNGDKIVSTLDLIQPGTHLKVKKGDKIILIDKETGEAPGDIITSHKGNNLHITFEKGQSGESDLIIEDFYGNNVALLGQAENGQYYSYVPSDGQADHFIDALLPGEESVQVLDTADSDVGAVLSPLALAALGVAALGGGIIVATHDDDDGGHDKKGVGDGNNSQATINTVVDDTGSITGVILNGGVTDDTMPTITGSGGRAGDLVTVTDTDGTVIGTATVGRDGNWTVTPLAPLAEGEHEISAVISGEDGNVSLPGKITLIVDTTPPGAPIITIIDNVGTIQGEFAEGAITDDNTPTINGTGGEAGDVVTVRDTDGTIIATTTVDANGSWAVTPTTPLTDGVHEISATITDPAGNISQPSTITITIDTS
ncbi:Biofilm associated protein A, partial [Salmonella enterica]|nr:Biofilm associated protein A [Salmonella enterica]ECW8875841.1 Biofilm associated protein A [Salmonella enterica]EIL1178320.1 Biofilm associated protein A [Salmonella enterica]EIO9955913.1 Biofilm associated protein A [Salmonella enterica]EIV5116115.1 Biofilm associated protein A [Salmonella enterica]